MTTPSSVPAEARTPLPYSTPMELWRAFKEGAKFVLHYHGRTFDVTHMQPREKVVYVQPPGMPVKVFPDGRSAEGPSPDIWLAAAPSVPAQGEAMEVLRELVEALNAYATFPARIKPALDRARALVAASPCAAPCTCHPDDNPPRPCPQKYAYSECAAAAQGGQQPAPVGVTGSMPGTSGFTMACFNAEEVPVGTPLYTAPAAPAAPLTEERPDPIRGLLMQHATLIEEGNDYAYFELAYTRQAGWMAWLTDRPASGEPGTAAYAASRKVIARGQGDSPDEACADALSVIEAAHGITLAGTAQKGGEDA